MNSIPKIIHYCWFGNNEKPALIKKCIESWKKYLPEYELREWNDDDLAQCENQYVKEAYKEKKWAFISDYFRLYALYNFGGIYLDTDNEVFKSLDEFLNLEFFTSYQEYKTPPKPFTALFGAKKGNKIVKELLDEYNGLSFYDEHGDINLYTNTDRVEAYFMRKYNIAPPYNPNKKIELENGVIIFPSTYFCKFDEDISYAVHHFNGSWVPNLVGKKRHYIFKKLYLKIYTITRGCFFNEIKNIQELPIFTYPRFKKRSVVITIGVDNSAEKNI